jgi:hypothetical protein
MRILAFIEDREVIKAILRHLGLWLVKSKPAPKAHAPPARNQDDSETYMMNVRPDPRYPLIYGDNHLATSTE